MYERGILSKDRTSVSLKHIRSVNIAQGFVNRILGVGTVQISTAGDEPEFTIADMPDPYVIQEAITKAQEMRDGQRLSGGRDATMPSASDRHDRKEALRLFVAAAIALLLLIVIGGAGFYYLVGLGRVRSVLARGSGSRTRRWSRSACRSC